MANRRRQPLTGSLASAVVTGFRRVVINTKRMSCTYILQKQCVCLGSVAQVQTKTARLQFRINNYVGGIPFVARAIVWRAVSPRAHVQRNGLRAQQRRLLAATSPEISGDLSVSLGKQASSFRRHLLASPLSVHDC